MGRPRCRALHRRYPAGNLCLLAVQERDSGPKRAALTIIAHPLLAAFVHKRPGRGRCMTKAAQLLTRAAAMAGLLALAACNTGDGNNLAEMDNSLIGNGADPALTSALEDQILV